MRRRTSESGFTLVETMITVSIIGILGMIAIPSVLNMMPKVRLRGATSTLANEIAMTRMSAIAKSADYGIQFNLAAGEYTLGRYESGTFTPFTTTKLGSFADIASVKYKSDYGTAPNTIKLYANGTTNVPMGKQAVFIQLQTEDGTVKKRVVVYTTGRIVSEKSLGGADADPANWKAD